MPKFEVPEMLPQLKLIPLRMLAGLVVGASSLACVCSVCHGQQPFHVLVQRGETADGLIHGRLSVNGTEVGPCYERADKHIPAGTYKAHLRHESGKNHVQGPGGKLGKKGDFLVELDDFTDSTGKKWTVVQLHAGNKPEHSDGCILCGPATKSPVGEPIAPLTLNKLRLLFYDGKDNPNSTPNKKITIEVGD